MTVGWLSATRIEDVQSNQFWNHVIVDQLHHRRCASLFACGGGCVVGAKTRDARFDRHLSAAGKDSGLWHDDGPVEPTIVLNGDQHAVHPCAVAKLKADGRLTGFGMNA